ncbi:right-handed parallel beta-helix repeat-containing protein, partial [Bartonella bovis]|uniref:right-handed parallel beta-helix repeat-containing protein n=1 Tax=Bartonella bovis TaxID=155194 RepID=UPI0011AFB3A2
MGDGSGMGSKGVLMDGTKMTMTDVTISNVAMGVEATAGTLEIKGGTRITFNNGAGNYGVKVGGTANATLERVTIEGTGGNGVGTGTGVIMEGSGDLMVIGGSIKEVQTGISMMGSGTLVVRDGTRIEFYDGDGYGVKVGGTANATLERVTIEGTNGNGTGVYATNGMLEMSGVTINDVAIGVEVTGTGTLEIKGGMIGFNDGDGYGVKVGSAVTSATLERVTIRGMGSGTGTGKGVIMEGKTLGMSEVNISNVSEGVWVKQGGTLTVNKGSIGFMGEYGIGVWGEATATITGTRIEGEGSGKGVYATGKAVTLKMTDVDISNVEVGVYASNGTVDINKGTIEFKGGGDEVGYGVMVGSSVKMATIMGTTITGDGKGTGVLMDGTNMVPLTMTLNEVNISNVGEGVWVKGTLVMKGGSIKFTNNGVKGYGMGVYVGTEATANITGTEIRGMGTGTMYGVVMNGKTLGMSEVTISNVSEGVWVKQGGTLTISGGSMTGVQKGITMMGSGRLMVQDRTRIEFKGGEKNYGIGVWGEATANITGTRIEGAGSGKGVYATGAGAVTLKMEEVQISNVGEGVNATNGTVDIKKGTIEFKGKYGIGVWGAVKMASVTGTEIKGGGSNGVGVLMKGAEMMMKDVRISGVKMGVYAQGGTVTVIGGSMTGVQKGMTMTGSGTLEIKDRTRIEFMGEYGVKVSSGVTMATITGTEIVGSGKRAMYGVLMDGTKMMMTDVRISEVEKGVEVKAGAMVMAKGSIGFRGEYGISLNKGGVAFLGEVNIEGNNQGKEGIKLNGGRIELYKTNIRDVQKGVTITEGIVRMFGGSVEFTGDHGISFNKGIAVLMGVNIMGNNQGKEGIKLNGGMVDLYKTNIRDVQKGVSVT